MAGAYWSALAARYFSIAPPLVPAPGELQLFREAVAPVLASGSAPRVLVLGATPAFYTLPWPAATQLLAVDRSLPMLESVWPGAADTRQCAEWTTLSLPADSRDIVLCDGGLSFLTEPAQLAGLAQILARILRPGGIFAVRIYSAGSSPLLAQDFPAQIASGDIRNSSELKLFLWLALAQPGSGVRLHDIWHYVHTACPDFAARVQALGWGQSEQESIEAYKDCNDIYVFPTSEQICQVFCQSPGGFERVSLSCGTGRFAEHTPVLILRRNP